jgi:hypothetical protein
MPGTDAEDERKERVLHTRVPESLDRHLKDRARRLGMSVSTVVRHVLLNTFGLVEDIVNDSADVAAALTGAPPATPGRRRGIAPPEENAGTAGVLAWQVAVLNRNAVCAECNAILRKGTKSAVGIREDAGARTIVCRRCLERLTGKRGRP